MIALPRTRFALISWGMLSFVLGVIALMLFFLPILGIPISAIGLLCGIIGVVVDATTKTSLRWSLLGCAITSLAVAINLAIAYVPGGYLSPPRVVPSWQTVPDRPYVPPPALPD